MADDQESGNQHGFCKIPMDIVDKYGDDIPFDIYLKLSDNKVVKIEKKGEHVKEVMLKYAQKGIQYIYADKEDFVIFINKLRGDMTKILEETKEDTKENTKTATKIPKEKRIKALNDCHEMVQEAMTKIGLSEDVAIIAKEVCKRSVELVSAESNIYSLFKGFKEQCYSSYMRDVMLAWTVTGMLDTFEWGNLAMREKLCMAAMLRDVILTKEDLKAMKERPFEELPIAITNHPLAMAAMIYEAKTEIISKEVADLIGQHHELPDGMGYPKKLKSFRISKLATLLIVGQSFIELMFKYNFDANKTETVINELWARYSDDKFVDAVKAIKTMLNKSHSVAS